MSSRLEGRVSPEVAKKFKTLQAEKRYEDFIIELLDQYDKLETDKVTEEIARKTVEVDQKLLQKETLKKHYEKEYDRLRKEYPTILIDNKKVLADLNEPLRLLKTWLADSSLSAPEQQEMLEKIHYLLMLMSEYVRYVIDVCEAKEKAKTTQKIPSKTAFNGGEANPIRTSHFFGSTPITSSNTPRGQGKSLPISYDPFREPYNPPFQGE